jgi:hypothetical protein
MLRLVNGLSVNGKETAVVAALEEALRKPEKPRQR